MWPRQRYIVSLVFILFLRCDVRSADCKDGFQSWMAQRLQGLENTLQRLDCQQYLSRTYNYEHLYRIDGITFDNVLFKKNLGDFTYLEMHLAVKGSKDANILLSPTPNPSDNDLVFEIGIGIASNQFTVLRLTKAAKLNEVTRINTQNILSINRYTRFYLTIVDDTLSFGREGDTPLISYYDPRLRTVKYFDMASWENTETKFLFDCPIHSQMYCYHKSP